MMGAITNVSMIRKKRYKRVVKYFKGGMSVLRSIRKKKDECAKDVMHLNLKYATAYESNVKHSAVYTKKLI